VSVQYILLGELKAMLRINDYVDDELLGSHIEAASRTIDDICHRTFSLDADASARVFYPDSPRVVRIDDVGSSGGFEVRIDNDLNGSFETLITANLTMISEAANAHIDQFNELKGEEATTFYKQNRKAILAAQANLSKS
jgi:hypothetical protein